MCHVAYESQEYAEVYFIGFKYEEYTDNPDPDTRYFLYQTVKNRKLVSQFNDVYLRFFQVVVGIRKSFYFSIVLPESLYYSRTC